MKDMEDDANANAIVQMDEPAQIFEEYMANNTINEVAEDKGGSISNANMEYDDDDDMSLMGNALTNASQSQDNDAPLKPDENLPCGRWGHSMNFIDGNRVLIYGGQTFDEKLNKSVTLTDLHVFDLTKRVWSKPVNCDGMPRCWVSGENQILANIILKHAKVFLM